MRMLALFAGIAVLHFGLSVAGIVFALPVAFDMQPGGADAAPWKLVLVGTSELLLAPLAVAPHGSDFGYAEIASVSVLFGLAAVAVFKLLRVKRLRRY
jgi:hypothetical protein